jgi:DNA-binding GntR family transcriptional regulator
MKPLRPQSMEDKGLSNWVTNSLREAILNGNFEPGEKLDQDLIASELNVSRTPIREALKVLSSEGFVEIRSYRGAFIPQISQQDIYDVYEIRWIVESEITRQATPSIPVDVLDYLQNLLNGDILPLDGGGDQRFYKVDQELHGAIARYCRNRLLYEILDKLNNRIVRVRSFALHQPGSHLDNSREEHGAVLAAMRSRDANEAGKMMELHLRNSARRIMKYLYS